MLRKSSNCLPQKVYKNENQRGVRKDTKIRNHLSAFRFIVLSTTAKHINSHLNSFSDSVSSLPISLTDRVIALLRVPHEDVIKAQKYAKVQMFHQENA